MEKRLTKKDYFEMLKVAVEGNEDLVNFIDHEIELLTRKASRPTKTKNQIENESLKEAIVNALASVGEPTTITDLQKANETMAQYSNQKLSALLKQLVADNKVVKYADKKKSYFSIAE